MLLREATEADWPAIHPFFSEIVAAGHTYAYPAGLSSEAARALWFEPGFVAVVAVNGAEVLGSAKLGPNRPGRGSHVATAAFMVAPSASGHGVGRALGEWVIGRARADGYRGIQFNAVVETNRAAVRLWTSLGFRIIGTVPGAFEHPEHGDVGLHVMHLPLAPVPPQPLC